jgi:hypothetical protein
LRRRIAVQRAQVDAAADQGVVERVWTRCHDRLASRAG